MAIVDQAKANYILSILKGLEYGSVVITIHDGTITQIDKTEKTRFALKKSTSKDNAKNK
ncbi:YezD family protein [Neobacillus sp. OS1-33]|uniref:YezD family protein n=1 Tax=Neobacillus sp. OS1-33 TaxID=3070683 RepID=UPI0027DEEF08|nr:YezD family protein [Neobacillus sp. OS1-33]WML28278.1 YezD family protein [Neobacillus sp. OS1-33]